MLVKAKAIKLVHLENMGIDFAVGVKAGV